MVCISDQLPDTPPIELRVDEAPYPARGQGQDSETSQSRFAKLPCCLCRLGNIKSCISESPFRQ